MYPDLRFGSKTARHQSAKARPESAYCLLTYWCGLCPIGLSPYCRDWLLWVGKTPSKARKAGTMNWRSSLGGCAFFCLRRVPKTQYQARFLTTASLGFPSGGWVLSCLPAGPDTVQKNQAGLRRGLPGLRLFIVTLLRALVSSL